MRKLKITAIVSGLLTFLQVLPPLISAAWAWVSLPMDIRTASSIGVIGSADGPTSVFVATQSPSYIITARQIFFVACLLTFIVSMILIIKNRNRS